MCGIVGFYNVSDLKNRSDDGLTLLQHRGVEGTGVFATQLDGSDFFYFRKNDPVEDFCESNEFLQWQDNAARIAIAHVRFGTSGSPADMRNVQPFMHLTRWGKMAVAHNGDTLNANAVCRKFLDQGMVLESDSDSELFLCAIANTDAENVFDAIAGVLARTRGTFSLLIMGEGWLVAARDPWGNRPLSVATLEEGWVVASETVAHDVLRAKILRDVEPGEMLVFVDGVMASRHFAHSAKLHQCVFEKTYLSRPDSVVFGQTVADFRRRIGRFMSQVVPRYPNEIIVPIPDSGVLYGEGFAEERGMSPKHGLVRSHYGGRSYIKPGQKRREKSVRRKFNPIRSDIKGKAVILIDDSIVRGTTSRKIVRMIRGAGAEQVVFVSCFPPVTGQCHYGVCIDEDLIAVGRSIEEIRVEIGADELYYPSAEDYKKLTGDPHNHCFACFDSVYPTLINITS